MKSTVRVHAGRGIVAGWLLFLLVAAAAYLTPVRLPAMRFAGRDYTALVAERTFRQRELEALQPHGAASRARDQEPAVERARTRLADAETRLMAWTRANARISPFGFLGWLSDLWPWLLGLGLALPALGGLIGVQIREARDAAARGVPSPRGEADGPEKFPPSPAASPASADAEPAAVPTEPSSWAWNAGPVVRPSPPRPKSPPVKSPNGRVDG